MVANPGRKKGKGTRVGLSRAQEDRMRERLRRTVPSEPWLDAQFQGFTDTDARGEPIVYRWHDPKAFPPGGKQTKMVPCRRCGVPTPPIAFEEPLVKPRAFRGQERPPQGDVLCMDCIHHAQQDMHAPSPSGMAIRTVRERKLCIEEAKLAPESKAALKKQIARYLAKHKKISKIVNFKP